jgi:hypothetical protein
MFKFNKIAWSQVSSNIGKYALVDVRNPEAHVKSRLKDSINVHEFFTYLATSNLKDMSAHFKKVLQEKGLQKNK